MKALPPLLLAIGLLLPTATPGQQAGPPGSQKQDLTRPAPRWPDGRISFTGTPKEIGNWEGPPVSSLILKVRNGRPAVSPWDLPTNPTIDQVPFRPWARKQYLTRQANLTADDPHTRCKPSGGPRFWHTPYGIEVLDLPETQEIIFIGVGTPHSWRIVYLDGRPHPKNLKPSWYGHSIGHWEGDTLVIDTVGFNERFWLTRGGVPHTSKAHLIERISRPNFYRLRYEVTIDDPGAYTRTWSGGWYLRWSAGNEPFDYLCQENNRDPARMVGPQGER